MTLLVNFTSLVFGAQVHGGEDSKGKTRTSSWSITDSWTLSTLSCKNVT